MADIIMPAFVKITFSYEEWALKRFLDAFDLTHHFVMLTNMAPLSLSELHTPACLVNNLKNNGHARGGIVLIKESYATVSSDQ